MLFSRRALVPALLGGITAIAAGAILASAPASVLSLNARAGRTCTVIVRNDLLNIVPPMDPMADFAAAGRATVVGDLLAADEQFVVVETPDRELWIPTRNVLVVNVHKR